MEFFAAGGFQQLFNDLDDVQQQQHASVADLNNELCDNYNNYSVELPIDNNNNNTSSMRLTCADDPFVLATTTTTTNEQTLLELHVNWCDSASVGSVASNCSIYNETSYNNSYVHLNSYECETISEHELQLTFDQLLNVTPEATHNLIDDTNDALQILTKMHDTNTNECNIFDNNKHTTQTCSMRLQGSMIEFETTQTLITREMAEWEEKFLDNYIEIPELIDFLPEKTPLCTDTCDHFLHESTKNLKLHRKVKNTKHRTREHGGRERCPATAATAGGYVCTFGTCDKIYAKPAHLKAHMRRHMGEKPYICNWPDCTWKFSRSDELARHRRSHSGVKPYKCNYCMKCFARSDHLTKHRKVHERRLLAASKVGKTYDGVLPHSVLTVRPGRKRKNQLC